MSMSSNISDRPFEDVKNVVENQVINEMTNTNLKNLIINIHNDLKELYIFFTDNDMKEFSLSQVKETLVNFKESFQQDLKSYNCDYLSLELQILSKLSDIDSSIVVMTQSLDKSFKLKCILHEAFSKNLRKLASAASDIDTIYCKCESKLKSDLKFFKNSTNYLINLRENEIRKKKEDIKKLSFTIDNDVNIQNVSDVDNLDVNLLRVLLKKEMIYKEMLDLENDVSSILSHNSSKCDQEGIDIKLLQSENVQLISQNKKLNIANIEQINHIKNLEQQIFEMKGNLVSAYNTMHRSLNVTKQFHLEQLKMYDSEMETES